MYNSFPDAPNFGPYVSPWVTVSSDNNPGEAVFMELASALQMTEPPTPLTEIFPEETIEQRIVVIEQRFEGTDTIFPLVEPGLPDVVLGSQQATRRQMMVQPLYIRASAAFSPAKLNYMLRPGTMNERMDPAEYIRQEMARMTREHNLTWDVYRAMMLLGGINYTDPRTGVSAQVSARIPAHNLFNFNVTAGYRGRNEATLFRSVVDQFAPQPATSAGLPWTHPDADMAHAVRRIKRWFKTTNKSDVTAMYVHPDLLEVINMNTQVRLAEGGVLPKFDATTGDRTISATATMVPPSGFDKVMSNLLTIGSEGVTAIAGVPIKTVTTKYKDPVDGIWKSVWPKNKVVLVSEVDPQGRQEAPGRTQYCISENLDDKPGLWVRMQNETQIPAAPGQYIQMGNAGMPYLKYPYRVAHLNVATVEGINDRLGILGDQEFGLY
jgi:hypothetical protein